MPGGGFCVVGKRMGNRISFIYFLIKIIYFGNAIGQLFLIMRFLGQTDNNMWAFVLSLFNVFKSKREWGGSVFFPRQTLCPVRVPHLGVRKQTYTAVCALPVNMFNEKIYIFLWVWIAFVAVVSFFSILTWLFRLMVQSYSRNFLRSFLAVSLLTPLSETDDEKQPRREFTKDQADRFLAEVVRCDGNFMIRMLRLNAGDVVAGEILAEWWNLFRTEEERCTKTPVYERMPAFAPDGSPPSSSEEKSKSGQLIKRIADVV